MRPGPGVVNEPGVVIVDVRDVRVLRPGRPAPAAPPRTTRPACTASRHLAEAARPAPDDQVRNQAPPTPYARARRPPARWRKAHNGRPGR